MGLNNSKETIMGAVKDMPDHLTQEQQGSVTVGFDPSKTPEENGQPTEKKPIVKNNPLINKYPDGSSHDVDALSTMNWSFALLLDGTLDN